MESIFKNKTVVVTGAGQGIGMGIARMYAENNANVVIADIQVEKGEKLVEDLKSENRKAVFLKADVSQPQDVINLMHTVYDQFKSINILINNAGINKWVSPFDLSVDEWDKVINTNLRGNFLCAREAAKYMKMSGGGAIVNIASTRALMSEPDTEAYAASKGGILALTHALAVSLSKDKIKVNAISPGWINTGNYDQLRPIDHNQHPSKRVGKPEDIARACLFLTDPANDFITGENLIIDGGMTRKMIYEE